MNILWFHNKRHTKLLPQSSSGIGFVLFSLFFLVLFVLQRIIDMCIHSPMSYSKKVGWWAMMMTVLLQNIKCKRSRRRFQKRSKGVNMMMKLLSVLLLLLLMIMMTATTTTTTITMKPIQLRKKYWERESMYGSLFFHCNTHIKLCVHTYAISITSPFPFMSHP